MMSCEWRDGVQRRKTKDEEGLRPLRRRTTERVKKRGGKVWHLGAG